MVNKFPVRKYKITDLPEEKQEWLKNLKPPTLNISPVYSLKQSKNRKK